MNSRIPSVVVLLFGSFSFSIFFFPSFFEEAHGRREGQGKSGERNGKMNFALKLGISLLVKI